ncbi:MAG TPA: histidine kinase [Candidatus Acidoferrum sp.]|nr:histidine kinase [Candidatus Acidoferrum sp.]
MHPLFTRNRLGLYLLAWVPFILASVYSLVSRGLLDWPHAIVLTVPVYLFYAFLCLSAWYPCRATPLGKVSFTRLLLTHLTAAAFFSFVWTRASDAFAYAILSPEELAGLTRQFVPQVNAVFTIGVLLYLLSVAFHYVLIAMEDSRRAEAQAAEAVILARDAELKALKAQINPHFLFNSLNSISALTSIDAGRAREMCVLLGEFLRLTLGLGEKAVVRFSEELDLLQKYLTIEKIRFGDRLKTLEAIQEESKACLLPPLLLQPLMENAIRHGIAGLPEGGEVRLTAERQNGRLEILVENSWDPDAPPRRSSGLGLRNVQQRLEARYGKDALMRVMAEGELFQVSLSIPVESEEKG